MSGRNARSVALVAALLGCAGCSPFVTRPGALPATTVAAPRAVPPAEASGPFLYVGGLKLSMFALSSSKPLHVAAVNAATVYKAALALDSHGHLCEANGEVSYAQLLAYHSATLKFVKGLTGVGAYPALVADRLGYLYASTGGGDIVVYAPGCTHQVNTIHQGVNVVGPLVFDRSGDLYAGMQPHYAVSIYAPTNRPGHMKLVRQIRDGLNTPIALAIGPSNQLFVANYDGEGKGYVTVYQPGGSEPLLTITKGINIPVAMAADSKGRLYVANNPSYGGGPPRPGWVSVYAPGGSQPVRKVRVGEPVALALDGSDHLYVANPVNHSSVLVYNAGAAKLLLKITDGVRGASGLLIGSP